MRVFQDFLPGCKRSIYLPAISCLLLSACGGNGPSAPNPPGGPSSVAIPGTGFTLSTSAGVITNVQVITPPVAAPTGYNYPAGFFTFSVTGLANGAAITITINSPAGTVPTTYIKCTTDLSSCQPYAQTGISGSNLTLPLTDGGNGDNDGLVNGVIVDPGAVAVAINTGATNFYLPYAKSGGSSGIFVVPSNQLTTAPQIVTSAGISNSYAQVNQLLTNSSGQVYEEVPRSLIYLTTGVPGGDNFFRLDLSNSSALTPTQVTNFLSTTNNTCDGLFEDQTDPLDPNSAFFIYTLSGGDSQCATADDQSFLFRVLDSAATAPVALPIRDTSSLLTLFDSSRLSGIVAVDATGNLNFYPSDLSFANPRQLLTGVTSFSIIDATFNAAFLLVNGTAAGGSVYRVDNTGAISSALYSFQTNGRLFGGAVRDPTQTMLYFGDNAANEISPGVTEVSNRLLRVALNGQSQAQVITSFTPTLSGTTAVAPVIQLDDFIGNALVFEVQAASPAPSTAATIYTIPTSAAGPDSTPSQIATLDNGYFGFNLVVGSNLFTNAQTFDGSGNFLGSTAEVLQVDGTLTQSYVNSQFFGLQQLRGGVPLAPNFATPNILLVRGYTATQGAGATVNLGGATVVKLSTDALTQTLISKRIGNSPDVSAYVLQDNEVPSLNANGRPVNAEVTLFQAGGVFQADAAALDLNQNLWEQITSTTDTDEIPLIQ